MTPGECTVLVGSVLRNAVLVEGSRMTDRSKRQDFNGDVAYDVWRSGGDPDSIDETRLDEAYWDGYEAEAFAESEVIRQRNRASALAAEAQLQVHEAEMLKEWLSGEGEKE